MKKKPKHVPKLVNSRKAQRQNDRRQKKINRHERYTRKLQQKHQNNSPGRFVKRPLEEDEDIPRKVKKQKLQPSFFDILSKERNKEIKEANQLKSQMEEQRKKLLLTENEEEDKMIKKLEKQLGLNKSKNKNNFFSGDGLDYLLEVCDKTTQEVVATEKHLADVDGESDFEDDLAAVTGKDVGNEIKVCDASETEDDSGDDVDDLESNMSDDGSVTLEDDCDEIEEINTKRSNESYKVKHKSEVSCHDEDEDDDDGSEFSDKMNDDVNGSVDEDKPDTWEDIYGRKRDKDGNIIKEDKGVYIPPQFRNKVSTDGKEMVQLKRQIKSVLNKLSGTNLHWASTTIENLYSINSRHSVNTGLSSLWVEAIVQIAMSPDRLISEYAALVAILHANVGTEIGAHFLEVLVKLFNDMLQTERQMESKKLDNLVAALSYLYNFKIYNSILIYDIFNRLLRDLNEKHIDCALLSLRIVGGVLRREEPASLKTFIHETQGRVAAITQTAEHGSRLKFLLDVLLAVKNNNLTKIPNYDPAYCEELKKNIKSVIRRGNYVTSLNIRLEDLLKADERGKWWVVGSAWEGNLKPQEIKTKSKSAHDEKLLELARKQRMNTDVRRSIFCVIMSAEDYMDAFEKLDHLGLRGDQQREIIHVLLACCLQEAKYNPYYAILATKLCRFERKYQLSIQYSVWDKIKDLESLPRQSLSNLAQFLTHLIMDMVLPLSVLKIIEFSDLNKSSLRFMRQILLAIIMNDDLQTCLAVFQRISVSPKLHMYRESLRLFIQHFLIRNSEKKTNVLSENDMEILKRRIVEVEKLLIMNENKLRF